jgi:hypothetical protein
MEIGLPQVDVIGAPFSGGQDVITELDGVVLDQQDADLFHEEKFLFLPDTPLNLFKAYQHRKPPCHSSSI